MRKTLTFFCLLALCSCARDNSLTLHFDKPASWFEESLILGNGNLGAIVYGGVDDEKIALNDITLWTGEPEGEPTNPDAYKHLDEVRRYLDAEDYRAADRANKQIEGHEAQFYQPLGAVSIKSAFGEAAEYSRSLDISRAVADVSFKSGGNGYKREYFTSAPDSVIAVRLTAKKRGSIDCEISYFCPQKGEISASSDDKSAEIECTGYTAYDFERHKSVPDRDFFFYDPERGIHFKTIVRVEPHGGEACVEGDKIRLNGCKEAIILISNVTSFNGAEKDPYKEGRKYAEDVRKRIDNASELGWKALKKRHVKDYSSIFKRLSLDLGETDKSIASLPTDVQLKRYGEFRQVNPDLEELYFQYGRYLLIACSRTPEVPANLQGLWNELMTPPWRSDYTVNINLEENYWPAETANLSEMHQSLLGFIRKMDSVTGRETAANYYGIQQGWCSGHNSCIWAMTNPVGECSAPTRWSCWTMGGAWLATHLWEHYAFTLDKEYLSEVYPTLKGAADFCLAWLIEKDGYLMTSPGTSPEAAYRMPDGFCGSTLYGGTADLAFTRECLIDAREAAIALERDNEFVDRVDNTLARLLPYRIGSRGNLQEWYHDWEDEDWRHRHQSHLAGLYPFHHISVEKTPELAAACAKSLEIKGEKTTGWSTGWRINLQAHLKDGEMAYRMFRMLLTYTEPTAPASLGGGTYPNLLDAHAPFQIDGNFGGCAGVIEMLVQSTLEDGATLLPALPEAWKAQGSIKGVKVRGAFELDFNWKDGKVSVITARSCREDEAVLKMKVNGSDIALLLKPGESKTLRTF